MFSPDEIQNLRQLLTANDLGSVQLGLTLLQTQEDELIKTFKEELFLVKQFAPFLSPEDKGTELITISDQLIQHTLKGKALKAFNSLILSKSWLYQEEITRHILNNIHNTCFNPLRFAKKLYYFDKKLTYSYLLQYGDEDTQFDLIQEHIKNNSIHLSYTHIEVVPKVVGRFRQLKSLVLSELDLDKLPKELENLKELEILHLNKCNFSEVPNLVYKLPKLKVLKLGQNPRLKNLPSDLYKLSALTMLDLSGNNYFDAEDSVGKMKQLKIFNWQGSPYSDYGNLNTFPIYFSTLPNLISLDLTNQRITTLPNELANLQELRNLYLTKNPIKEFPKPLFWMPKLKRLSITLGKQDCPCSIPANIHQLKQLEKLTLENCYFKEAPTCLALLSKLKQLKIKDSHYLEKRKYIRLDAAFFQKLLPNCKVS